MTPKMAPLPRSPSRPVRFGIMDWLRGRVIPLDVEIPPGERDPKLRLFPDMYPYARQVQQASTITLACSHGGLDAPVVAPRISGSLDLRAEPNLLVAAARLVRPRHRRLEGGPRREVFVPRVDVRPALP
jgi:hypothetical protein